MDKITAYDFAERTPNGYSFSTRAAAKGLRLMADKLDANCEILREGVKVESVAARDDFVRTTITIIVAERTST